MKPGEIFEFGDFQLDVPARILRRHEVVVTLNRRAFDVLAYLVRNPGRALTRDELLKNAWPDTFVDENSLAQSISALRHALKEKPGDNSYIVTLPGRGYQFVSAVKIVAGPDLTILPDLATAASDRPAGLVVQRETIRTSTTTHRHEMFGLAVLCHTWVKAGMVAMVLCALATYVGWHHFHTQAEPSRVMLAVLPFQNLTGDPGQEYFADGITEEMITKLGQLHPEQLGIIACTSVMGYKHGERRVDQIGRELSVQYVLEGSFRRAANHVRITTQLIRVKDQSHLWAADYDRQLEDVVRVQDDVAMAVAKEIQPRLMPQQHSNLSSSRVVNPVAYEAYLRGRFFWNQRTEDGFRKALAYFEAALAEDSNYAPAYAGLADTYMLLGGYQFEPQDETMPKAKEAALRAIQIDGGLAEPYVSLGLIYLQYEYNWGESGKSFRRAIELNPNYSVAHHFYAEYLFAMGQTDEAISEFHKAQELDPLSLVIETDLANRLCLAGRFDEGMRRFQEVLDIDPNFILAHLYRSQAYVLQKNYPDALVEIEKARSFSANRPYVIRLMGVIYAFEGKREKALEIVDELKERSKHTHVDPGNFADIYAALGDRDQALAYLQKAYEVHSPFISGLKDNWIYEPIRSDPRFAELVRKAGIP
jgi:TolB-like protein/DNA-binding winged helix-turn-helix (wHTH) protein/Tfp pilus assembly protein PilF